MSNIAISHLCKSFSVGDASHPVLRDFCLEADADGVTVLLGRSGCGKTTLLRLICGLEKPDSGEIRLPPDVRVGMVFQEARLMPWLTTEENIAFGLGRRADKEKVRTLVERVGLAGFEQAYPDQLSGGMQQRAALARTLMRDCSLILMDEPFAALDYFTRAGMQRELLRIRRESGTGILFVTHNIEEALTIGDRVLVMLEGRVGACIELAAGERDLLSEPLISAKREILAAMQ